MASFLYYNPPVRIAQLRSQQGKVAELRIELNSGGKKDKNYSMKKIALKRIVANMTMSNNDMVALFPDVIGCMNLPSLEIKKMFVLRGEPTYTLTDQAQVLSIPSQLRSCTTRNCDKSNSSIGACEFARPIRGEYWG